MLKRLYANNYRCMVNFEIRFERLNVLLGPNGSGKSTQIELLKEKLDDEVKNYEPELALFCESTAKMYGAIERICTSKLKDQGIVYLEIHEDHADEILELFNTPAWDGTIKNDYSGKPRFYRAKKK